MAITRALSATARAAGRVLGALLAVAVTLGVIAGIPWALLHYAGDPLPTSPPTLTAAHHALTSAMTPQTLLKCLSIAGWYLWLILALSFAVELAAALRRVNAPHIPTLGPTQALAAALIAAIGITALARPATASAETGATVTGARVASTAPAAVPVSLAAAHTQLAATTVTARETVHAVVTGDSLYSIAKQDLGDGEKWPQLYKLNTDKPQPGGSELTNPDLILPGWRIQIEPQSPTSDTTTTSRTDATGPAPATSNAAPRTGPTATTPTSPAPESTGTQTAPATAPPTRSAEETPHPPHVPNSARPAAPSRHDASGAMRIDLADGGAIAGSLLLALLGALALVRRHRRRFTSPCWPIHAVTLVHDELPPALRRAQPAAGEADDGGLDEFGAPINQPRQPADPSAVTSGADFLTLPLTEAPVAFEAAATWPGADNHPDPSFGKSIARAIAVAHTATGEIALDQLPGGMGLIGPGALGLARAIAAAVLTDGAADNRIERPRLIIGRGDLALVLEDDPDRVEELCDGVAELDVTEDLTAALALLEEHLAYRSRLLEDYDCTDLDELAEQHGDLEPHPPLILLGLARENDDTRLAATAAAGAALRAQLVLLGSHPTHPTWTITGEGAITGESDPRIPKDTRVFDLPATALRESLALLAAAAGTGLRDQPSLQEPDPAGPLAIPLGLGDYADPAPEPFEEAEPESPARPEAETTAIGTAADQEHDALSITPAPTPATLASPSAIPAPPSLAVPEHPAAPPQTPTVAAGSGAKGGTVTALLATFNTAIVRVRVLGPLVIEGADGPITTGLRANSRRLAARLAIHHRRGQSGEELAALWPDLSGKELSETRKTAMAYLRGPLRKATGATSAQFVLDASGRYRLDPQLVGVDLALFDQLRTLASRTTDPLERAAAAEAALQLCDGELLTGNDEAWIEAARAGVRRDALATAALLAQLATDDGDMEAALGWWEKARVIDDNEEVYRQIMKTLAALGRRVEIIATRDLLIAKLEAIGEYLAPQTEQLLGELLRERPRPATTTTSHRPGPGREHEHRLVGGARAS
jgi:LysM repeat protein